jgi:Ferric reductase like transmembrane component
VAVWWTSVNDPLTYARADLPSGQVMYLVAKLAGMLGFFLFWLQCMLALARRAPMLKGLPSSSPRLHRVIGATTALLILAHVVFFVAAASTRSDHIAWDLLWPDFTHGYYRTNIGLGVLALWFLPFMLFAGWRVSRGHRGWKPLHMVWPLVFGLVFVHAFAIGTESRFGAMRQIVLFVVASLAISLAYRFRRKRSGADSE